MKLSIAIAGAAGRMGRALIRAAAADARFTIVGASVRPGSSAVGADLGALAGLDNSLNVAAADSVRAAAAKADIWIDFSSPEASLAALKETDTRAILGATGFSLAQEAELGAAAHRRAIVRSGNFSLGLNLLAGLVRQTAQKLGPDWDIEIAEAHHRRKADAPSGSALMLGEAAAAGRGAPLADLRLPPHAGAGAGARRENGIGFSSVRGGGIVGDHEVMFASEREVLRLSHQSLDRAVFAEGALAAALWAADKPPGLYAMSDVLGV